MSQLGPVYELPRRYRRLCKERGQPPANDLNHYPPPLATTAGLSAHSAPLTLPQAGHLLRRTGFGSDAPLRKSYVGMSPLDAANRIVDEALNQAPPPPPSWANHYPPWGGTDAQRRQYNNMQFQWYVELTGSWVRRMTEGGLREKLTLFWHDHFATERDTYFFTILALDYVSLLREHALGNFKEFVVKVGINPAMLVYLDGRLSTRQEPNENYSRELLELFTMGQYDRNGGRNYIEKDVVELSRCLTGYQVDYADFTSHLTWGRTDHGTKELLGRTGNFNFGAAHNVIFEERGRQIAEFIAAKLYSEFVYVTPHPETVTQLADVFLDSGFEIAPVLRALLSSEHFYAAATMGARPKSPSETLIGLLNDVGMDVPDDASTNFVRRQLQLMSQSLLNPPSVAGWDGYRSWISSSTLLARWEAFDTMFANSYAYRLNPVGLARELVDEADPLAVFKVPVALAEHILSVPLDILVLDAPENFAGDLQTFPIPDEVVTGPQHVRDLAKIFLAGKPWYEWDLSQQGIAWGIGLYMRFLTRLPEYQLA